MKEENNGWSSFETKKAKLVRLFDNAHLGSLDNVLRAANELVEETSAKQLLPESSVPKLEGAVLHVLETCRDGKKWTTLHFAAAALAEDESGLTPLAVAARSGKLEACEAILNRISKLIILQQVIDHQLKGDGRTPLHFAIQSGNTDLVTLLIDRQASINLESLSYGTPLLCAVMDCRADLVKLLLKCSVDINKATASSSIPPPLVLASAMGQHEIVNLLLDDPKLNINVVDSNGWSSLHCAAESGYLDIVKSLVKKGIDLHYSNQNQNALDLAMKNHQDVIINYLKSLNLKETPIKNDMKLASNHQSSSNTEDTPSVMDHLETENIKKPPMKVWNKKHQTKVDNLKLQGNKKVELNDYNGALYDYQSALIECSQYKDTEDIQKILHGNLSFVLNELKRHEDALKEANEAIRLDNSWAKGYFRASRAFESLANFEEATHMMWQATLKSTGVMSDMYKQEFERLLQAAQKVYQISQQQSNQ